MEKRPLWQAVVFLKRLFYKFVQFAVHLSSTLVDPISGRAQTPFKSCGLKTAPAHRFSRPVFHRVGSLVSLVVRMTGFAPFRIIGVTDTRKVVLAATSEDEFFAANAACEYFVSIGHLYLVSPVDGIQVHFLRFSGIGVRQGGEKYWFFYDLQEESASQGDLQGRNWTTWLYFDRLSVAGLPLATLAAE